MNTPPTDTSEGLPLLETTPADPTAPAWVQPPDLNARWAAVQERIRKELGQERLRLEALLLLVGMREVGLAPARFEKDVKLDLMHVGTCAILTPPGYYRQTHTDADGWPHYEVVQPLPYLDVFDQVNFIRLHLTQYFEAVFES